MDHVSFVGTQSDRFRAALSGADPTAAVPSCPGWTAADLLARDDGVEPVRRPRGGFQPAPAGPRG